MLNFISIFIGGGLGSILRHLVSSRIGNHWGVMLVNVCGAFLIGWAFYYFANKSGLRPEWRMFCMTGVLGGFTTFSTYMLDFGQLVGASRHWEAAAYLLLSIVIGVASLFAGMAAARVIG